MIISPHTRAVNQAVQALKQVAPWLLLAMLLFSAACAFFYSRYLARPIVRLSGIAQRMAGLDFGWQCQEQRRDEIGVLGRSLDHMAQQLSGALTELKQANDALRGEMEQERELERQRLAFFSAASHELKTPITILKGQLTGMLDGVDVYRDRDKYLARSLQVTGRMETLVQEILTISRMESGAVASKLAPLDLSELVRQQLELDRALFAQRQMRVQARLTPALTLRADAAMLARPWKMYSPTPQPTPLVAPRSGCRPALQAAMRSSPSKTPACRLAMRPCHIYLRRSTAKNSPATAKAAAAAWACIWSG